MDPRTRQCPPVAPEVLTGSASQEGIRRLLRSQPRRLGFGQPPQARPRCGCANIPCGSQPDPQNRNFLLGWEPELSIWLRHQLSVRAAAVLAGEWTSPRPMLGDISGSLVERARSRPERSSDNSSLINKRRTETHLLRPLDLRPTKEFDNKTRSGGGRAGPEGLRGEFCCVAP